jgi:hypothetical protein
MKSAIEKSHLCDLEMTRLSPPILYGRESFVFENDPSGPWI